jgi:antitoxin CptB
MDLETRRKRLIWRATHRGTKEMDLMLGGFATAHIERMTPSELDELEAVVGLADPELYAWIMGEAPVPPEHHSATLARLLAFRP